MQQQFVRNLWIVLLVFSLTGCMATPRPNHVDNICRIFRQYPHWYWATQDAASRWRVPIHVQMAIIHQESRFTAKAKPPRKKLLWIIPWKRPSSSYGYTQALKETWEHYKNSANKTWVSRDDFADAADFVGWYANQAKRKVGIPSYDSYRLYLAYHEGLGGYKRRTYAKKKWLVKVARKVEQKAQRYQVQLSRCQKRLPSKPWYRFW